MELLNLFIIILAHLFKFCNEGRSVLLNILNEQDEQVLLIFAVVEVVKIYCCVIMLDSLIKVKSFSGNRCDTDKIWKVVASQAAKNCKNYIRDIVDNLTLEPNPEKNVIALSLG